MGNICSCCCGNRDDDIFEGSENDKTNLLGNPVGETSQSAGQSISNKPPPAPIGDQQAKLNQILEKTANSYIDLPALNSPMDQTVYKTKDYGSQIEAALQKQLITERTSLLEDIPYVKKTLSDEPLSEKDSNMLKEANSLILAALQSMEVKDSENLVIPFNTPKDKK